MVIGEREELNNIPGISGLLAYSRENQTLHVKTNDSWKSLAENDKVLYLHPSVKISKTLVRLVK